VIFLLQNIVLVNKSFFFQSGENLVKTILIKFKHVTWSERKETAFLPLPILLISQILKEKLEKTKNLD